MQELGEADPEARGEPVEIEQADIALAPFGIAHIGAIEPNDVSKCLLR